MRETLILLILTGAAFGQMPAHSYVGAGGCKSSNCHGATSQLPENQSRIQGNEFAVWSSSDRHSRAYMGLTEDRGKRMAEILKISNPTTDKRCTVCHVVGSPDKSASDGVACEGCHGPASDWLGSHLQVKSNSPDELARVHADSVQKGMIDTKKLDVRAQMCLACHLGQGDQVVDHDLIAAGHPDLAFELVTFTVGQPKHHRDPKPSPGNALPSVRAWAVGQSMDLSEGMRLLAAHAAKNWPEFSDLECYQCHHDLRADSWRIQHGYGNRNPGSPQVNLARLEVMRDLVAQTAPDQLTGFDAATGRLSAVFSTRFADGAAIAPAATALERVADSLTTRFVAQNFDAAATQALIRKMASDIQRIAYAGVHSAEQATMSLDALTSALPVDPRKPPLITDLYKYLEHPSKYMPAEFMGLFQKAAAD